MGTWPAAAALVITYVSVYGLGFELVTSDLAGKASVQKSQLLLYPWRTFFQELNALPAREIALSSDLRSTYRMTAATEAAIAELALGRYRLRVRVTSRLPADAQTAIASRETYYEWLREMPALAETGSFGPSGFLVLVRPREASGLSGTGAPPPPTAPQESIPEDEIEDGPTGGGPGGEGEE